MSAPPAAGLLSRIQKLIALTASPFLVEARTAAFTACRLIREHGLTVAEPAAIELRRSSPSVEPDTRRRPIPSRFDGRCRICGYRYQVGETVWWVRGQPTICEGCFYEQRHSTSPPSNPWRDPDRPRSSSGNGSRSTRRTRS